MKTLAAILFASALFSVPFSAVAQTETALPPTPRVEDEAFVWKFAPPLGSRWTMRYFVRTVTVVETPSINFQFDSTTGNSQSRPGQPFVTQTTRIQRFAADYDVLSRDALGATTIRLTYREMADDTRSVTKGMSRNLDLPRSSNPKAIDGATLTFKQAPDGKIWNVLGGRAFQRRMWEASDDLREAENERLSKVSDAILNAELVKSLDVLVGILPASPIRVGESWTAPMELSDPLPRPLKLSGARTLKSLTLDSALIADSVVIDVDKLKDQIPVVPGQGQMQFGYRDVSGSIAGTARVARASGLPLERQLDQKFQGVISTPLGDGEGNIIYVSVVRADIQTSTRIVLVPR